MRYPEAENINRELDTYQRFIVNLAKGQYEKVCSFGQNYDKIVQAIEIVVYGNKVGRTPDWVIVNYLKDILLATGVSYELLDYRQRQYFKDAQEASAFFKDDFFEIHRNKWLNDVVHLTVNDTKNGAWEKVLDLDVDEELENKWVDLLDKYTQSDII